MWVLILALSHTSADLGPKEFPTEKACISAGEGKRYMGNPVEYICKRVE